MARTAAQIRQDFLDFFRRHEHAIVPGSPVIPYEDPTLLFTNAGMNQFKDVFLGTGDRPYKRAANSQPCIRAGGKHNDLDDVGHDTYHHTLFEMLGNWSFGDYFKREAIAWAWDLLTNVWGLDPQRLHATYFEGDAAEGLAPDEEARSLWASETGINPKHIHPGNKKDNFWEMGDTGPCGPCSEVHVDLTPDISGAALVNAGDARVIEIWNLVFIQFNRGADARLTPLPAKHVDTGMGFERVSAILQGHNNNYGTESFIPILQAIENLTGHRYGSAQANPPMGNRYAAFVEKDMRDTACRVIADHVRTLTFALTDGAMPDKEGRGYVLRRILRRAVRYGWQHLDQHEPFVCRLVPAVLDALGGAFPKLKEQPQRVIEVIREEEESFARTLGRGLRLFEDAVDQARTQHHNEIRGEDAFKLHDTYGFPIDLTQIMAAEKGFQVDIGEYERLMEEARERARAADRNGPSGFAAIQAEWVTPFGPTAEHHKYSTDTHEAIVRAVVKLDPTDGPVVLREAEGINVGDSAGLVLDQTCFYAEQGGQVGDTGFLTGPQVRFQVDATHRYSHTVVHFGTLVQGRLKAGDHVTGRVGHDREQVKQNHTATHVLNWALREVLGEHVQQRGSLVDAHKTRFDFSHPRALSPAEVARVEELCARQIADDLSVHAELVPQVEAMGINGLRAVFGEKYPEIVRVVSIGAPVDSLLADPQSQKWRQYSIEFCGGTHLQSTGQIGAFALVTEESVAKGIRRVVGVSGASAELADQIGAELVRRAEELLASTDGAPPEELSQMQHALSEGSLRVVHRVRLRELIGELQQSAKQRQKAAAAESGHGIQVHVAALLRDATEKSGVKIVIGEVPATSVDVLKNAADSARQNCGSALVLLAARDEQTVTLVAAMSLDLIKKGVNAGDLVKAIAPIVGGGGGGPPTMAQAGGKKPAALPEALAAAREWALRKIG